MTKKVSIIIPVYNGNDYIRKCLESVISQTYNDIEVIIVDDGSIDHTADIVCPYTSLYPYISLIQQENKGVSCARNTALDYAMGDYIAFVDADDEILPTYIENLVEAMETKECQLAVCGYQSISDKDGQVIEETHLKDETCSRSELLDKVLRHMNISLAIWNKLFLASIIKTHNIRFDSSITIGEDMMFLVEYSLYVEKCITLSKHLYKYYIRTGSAITQYRDCTVFNKKWLTEWTAINLVEKKLQQYSENPKSIRLKKTRIANKLISIMRQCDYSDEILEDELLYTIRSNIIYAVFESEFTIKEKIVLLINAISPRLCIMIKKQIKDIRKQ